MVIITIFIYLRDSIAVPYIIILSAMVKFVDSLVASGYIIDRYLW